MQLFYEPHFDSSSQLIQVNPVESRHMSKVLRKNIGDKVFITNGSGLLAEGVLKSNHPKKCEIEVLKMEEKEASKHHLHIAIAPTKTNDRLEWFLEKATEIGIQEITPLLCEHSERRTIKPERYEKVLQAAMKQSLTPFIPKLNPLISFSEFITSEPAGPKSEGGFDAVKCIAHCEDEPKESLSKVVGDYNLILIGPEGDFSKAEIELALSNGFKAVSLSDSRLRTETAGIVACHTVHLIQSL
ncbi:16S rRNA (uracil(1498)-N(3))-methyltransferase [Psychroflexus sp. YR1-1]|uniref:Ribosomal RNA small subunit methyltransferase E n=1 Tax=Psychroflexus aurantiacus TaxID=2709310 RepID=A0A6B3R186_9FLAO|nr:16S rRNA (uracil(1498)-N(3))-methyltransferase [Psychroflexus aurantiacus]NEV94379.1 16S rRNA (uracil(1498)-N(3))-methyltransferase [Psychroflexus aurantiacus]